MARSDGRGVWLSGLSFMNCLTTSACVFSQSSTYCCCGVGFFASNVVPTQAWATLLWASAHCATIARVAAELDPAGTRLRCPARPACRPSGRSCRWRAGRASWRRETAGRSWKPPGPTKPKPWHRSEQADGRGWKNSSFVNGWAISSEPTACLPSGLPSANAAVGLERKHRLPDRPQHGRIDHATDHDREQQQPQTLADHFEHWNRSS